MRQYGRNVELLVQKAVEEKNEAEQENMVIYLGRLIKRFYYAWNPDFLVEDAVIIEHIKRLSKGQLTIDIEKVKALNLFYTKPVTYTNYQTSNPTANPKRSYTSKSPRTSASGGSSYRSSDRKVMDKKRRITR